MDRPLRLTSLVLSTALAASVGVGSARAMCVGGAPNGVRETGEECDDGVQNHGCCTSSCTAVVSPPSNPTPCHDGNVCTCEDPAWCPDPQQADHCDTRGVCVGGVPMETLLCNDHEECTTDTCDPSDPAGPQCKHVKIPRNAHHACMASESCQEHECDRGVCKLVGTKPATAACDDDGDCCTADHCDGNGACVHSFACGGTSDGCDQLVTCDPDVSHPAACSCITGAFPPDGTPCNDGTLCTTGDHCVDHRCVGTPIDLDACDDGNPCTAEGCDPAVGCIHAYSLAGTFCDTPCFLGACDDGGRCVKVFNKSNGTPCPGVDGQCTLAAGAACENGICTSVNKPDGTPCDDGNPCTDVVECRGGVCRAQHCNTDAVCVLCSQPCDPDVTHDCLCVQTAF